jgi:hypothetical protein
MNTARLDAKITVAHKIGTIDKLDGREGDFKDLAREIALLLAEDHALELTHAYLAGYFGEGTYRVIGETGKTHSYQKTLEEAEKFADANWHQRIHEVYSGKQWRWASTGAPGGMWHELS